MPRKVGLAVLVVVTLGCARPEQAAPPRAEREEPFSVPIQQSAAISVVAKAEAPPAHVRAVVRVGQPLDEAIAALKEAGAEDFSRCVGTFRPAPWEQHWFTLQGNTCLCVLARADGVRGAPFVERLTLGEEGRGYGGKWRWPEQSHRTVDRLELPKVAPAREPESPFPKPGPRVRTYRVVDLVLGKE